MLFSLLAVYFEQGDYDKTIETCETAVEEGRSVRLFIEDSVYLTRSNSLVVTRGLQTGRQSPRPYRLSLPKEKRPSQRRQILPEIPNRAPYPGHSEQATRRRAFQG